MAPGLDRTPARMDLLQGLTGLGLVLFVWGHMFFESSILMGKDAMLWVTRMFEGQHLFGTPYPALVSFAAAVIFTLIVIHALLAMRKFPASYRQYRAMHRHLDQLQHEDTTLWAVQVITGFAMFFLASAHLFLVFLQPSNIGPYASADRIWSGHFWLLYAPLLLCVHLHAGIGAYRLAVKWLPLPAASFEQNRRRLKRSMWIIIGFFLVLGTASLLTYMTIGYHHADRVGERYIPAEEAAGGAH